MRRLPGFQHRCSTDALASRRPLTAARKRLPALDAAYRFCGWIEVSGVVESVGENFMPPGLWEPTSIAMDPAQVTRTEPGGTFWAVASRIGRRSR